MTRPASKAPGWVLEDLASIYAPLLLEGERGMLNPPRGEMARTRVRRVTGHGDGDLMRHARAVLGAIGGGRTVELLDGWRGLAVGAFLPLPLPAGDAFWNWARWEARGWARSRSRGHHVPGVADDAEVAALVEVQLLDGSGGVLVEIERVAIPGPAHGDVDAFIASKRDPKWKAPKVALPRARSTMPPRGTAFKVGLGSIVRALEYGDEAQQVRFRGVVIDRGGSVGHWTVQRLEDSGVGCYGSATEIHNSRLELLDSEAGQYA